MMMSQGIYCRHQKDTGIYLAGTEIHNLIELWDVQDPVLWGLTQMNDSAATIF